MVYIDILPVVANHFGSKFAEASCLGEHEVAVSSKKKFIPRRFQNLTEPYKPFSEAQTYFWDSAAICSP